MTTDDGRRYGLIMSDSRHPFDRSIWRVLGDPLLTGDPTGPLHGRTAAVKDLYAVAGQPVGAGVAAWLAEQQSAQRSAAAVDALSAAGVDIIGITRTDQFAFSMAGQNADYGTPPNGAAPGRIPGGSSSGSASAVALGQVDLALGTDTGGSVRVPASYQGIFGIRTSHDLVSRAGLLDLAPSFDTVGWFTRDAALLADVGGAGPGDATSLAGRAPGADRPRVAEFRRTGHRRHGDPGSSPHRRDPGRPGGGVGHRPRPVGPLAGQLPRHPGVRGLADPR
jgi:Asp-tRNA(Asn)/Glu-tRNA(Gln) amidotransferase A subunit family amidase